ncbi:GIP [Symbiodinium sp. KB8]|nr:GIP [Symbiodinium sp. KB8]
MRRRRLTGDLERITKIYEAALDVYRTLPTTSQRPPPSVDILEIFAGEAKPSARASRFGLNACQPFDLNFGWDLSQPDQQRMIMNVVRRLRPWAIIIGYPGTLYSVFGENINDKADEYLLRRAADQPMRVRQYEAGRLFFLDNPKNSRLWSQTEMASLLDLPGVTTTTAHFGACGAETADGQPIKKAIQIMSNFPGLSRDFGKRLSATDLLYCTPVQGNLSATTQVYPDAFVDQLLTSIKGWIAQHEPQRFGYFTVYALSRPTVDAAAWDNVFKQVERSFVGSNRRPYIVDPDSTFGKEIQDLFRMDAVRIQVANTPTQRRFHSDIPHLARGAALQHIDGSRLVEVEQLDEVRQPKGRFSKPVQFAVFIYGSSRQADELQQSTQEDPGPEVPIGGLPTDVNFPGCDKIPISVRRSVARLHVNLGHPSAQELSRLLCHRGVPSAGVQECVRKLSCATCKRLAGMRHTAVGRGTTFPPASSQQLLLYMFLAVVVQGLLLLRRRHGANPPDGDTTEASEQPESENLTYDPAVSEMISGNLKEMISWRGGTPPTPPAWRYDPSDLRAFSKWMRKVQIWQVQIAHYMTKREAALLLYTSLTGEAEAELEHVPLEKINCDSGVEFILESLREPMAQETVYQKRKYLADFESISRYPDEGLRTYANRYRRIERLLERARLSQADQRLVLVGSRYSLSFEDVMESMTMQYPDFRAAPPVMGRDGQVVSRGAKDGKGAKSPGTPGPPTSASSRQHVPGQGKGG